MEKMALEAWTERAARGRWDETRVGDWYRRLPWLVGCNYNPSCASNQLEMWQADTFAPETIERELGFLAGVGMNTVRVFLHDLAWAQDPDGFLERVDEFLGIAARAGIGVMPVFFDSVWHPFPYAGKQREPEPGVHNSTWLQSPGLKVLRDPKLFAGLRDYVTAVVGRFQNDARIQLWDVWNEPDNNNGNAYGPRDLPAAEKLELVLPLLAQAFEWVRQAAPAQPLTSGIWNGDWTSHEALHDVARLQVEASDVVSFHRYLPRAETRRDAELLLRYGRPLICTEYLARPTGSTFEAILPYFKEARIGAYSWGSVAGRSQTIHAWDTWQKPDEGEPATWFHDIFRPDGSPFSADEAKLIRDLTA